MDEKSDVELAAEILASAIRMMSEENAAIAEHDRVALTSAAEVIARAITDAADIVAGN